jgi:DNA-binding transcriptional ArsR family regulator
MSNTRHSQALKRRASIFAALGDQTRLTVLARLSAGEAQSIARLTAGSRLSRQAMTKHLGVLTRAGIVHSMRIGRENLFRSSRGRSLTPEAISSRSPPSGTTLLTG